TADVGPLGELAVRLTMKNDRGKSQPVAGIRFDVSCTGDRAFSAGLDTDRKGGATTYARPGTCLVTSRSPLQTRGKRYAWRVEAKIYRDSLTTLNLSEDN